MTQIKPQDLVGDMAPAPSASPVPDKLTSETIAGLKVARPSVEGYINMLIYGDPGVGKTRLAGSSCMVPEMCPVLLLDWEGGTLSLTGDYGNVEVWPDPKGTRRPTWKDVDQLYGALYNKNPYKTIIIDSLTELQKFCISQVMQDVIRNNPDRDPDVASLREWGKQSEQMRRFVRAFRDLPCNTIFTALAREETDEQTKIMKIKPGLPGQMKGEVAGYVDIVAYMYQKEVRVGQERDIKTLLLTQKTERNVAKDRSGKLPPIMESPTMAQIYNLIHDRAA